MASLAVASSSGPDSVGTITATENAHGTTSEADNLVQDPEADIAFNEYLEGVKVGVPGRRRFQRIFVKVAPKGKGSTSKTPYNAKSDALPLTDRTVTLTPTKPEIEGRPNTEEYVVVGLVFAKEPTKFSRRGTGTTRGKKSQEKKPVMESDQPMVRAVVKSTEFLSGANIKYYVACLRDGNGLCEQRTITAENIFYFSEVWDLVVPGAGQKERRTELGKACRKAAARNDQPPERSTIQVTSDKTQTLSEALAVTREHNVANHLGLHLAICEERGWSHTELVKLLEAGIAAVPEVGKIPIGDDIRAFFDMSMEFTQEQSESVIKTIKASFPDVCQLDAKLIREARAFLRTSGFEGKLPYRSLVVFLELLHDCAANQTADTTDTWLSCSIQMILRHIGIMEKTRFIPPLPTASEPPKQTELYARAIAELQVCVREVRDFAVRQATALKEQHGGISHHRTIAEIMLSIGNCQDKIGMMGYEEEIFAIHAQQFAAGLGDIAQLLTDIVAYMGRFIGDVESTTIGR